MKWFIERVWFYCKFVCRESYCNKKCGGGQLVERIRFCWNISCRGTVCRRNFVLLKFLLDFSEYIYHFTNDITFFVLIFSCRLYNKKFLLYKPGWYIQWECVSQCIWSDMHDTWSKAETNVRMCCPCMTYTKPGQYDFLFSVFLFLQHCFYFLNVGLISSNLLYLLLFQRCCLYCWMYLFIFILKSVYGILSFFSVVIFRVDLAALSAWSFPLIPVWFGTEHIYTL